MDPTAPQTVEFSVDLPLNEVRRRRPNFSGGIPVRLDDGQEWWFPRPLMEIRPDFTGVEPSLTTWGAEYDQMIKASADTLMAIAQKWFRIARFMLQKNYILTDADLQILLAYRTEDEANQNAWKTIAAVAYGDEASPKAEAAG